MKQRKCFTLKQNMFPMLVLEKLASENKILETKCFFEEYDRTNNLVVHATLRNPLKWKIDSISIRLRQMKFRGLIERIDNDKWKITTLGEFKLKQRKKEYGNT
jgi:hypothetical protein